MYVYLKIVIFIPYELNGCSMIICGKPNYEKKIDSIRILFEYNASIRINEYYHRKKQTESFTSIMHSELGTLEYLLSASHDVP